MSIPDELFRRAEELAQRLGKPRSQIYREALAEYVARRDPAAITQQMDDVIADVGERVDEWTARAARAALERNEW